ncbi:cache domain-containing sensor histidine kinase [Paenibacillus glycanilyticus]|uniref:cache domain-containing sensor histidine kinase n=1 Tax=Paenibacillus glycanilyticus TaxID=126569 RepID=UPI00191049FF|nr:histidine kinase [Paenibacillus glycanilyticus]
MNIRKWFPWHSSLRLKLILSVLFMTIPLVGMLLYNNFYAIKVVRGQVADSYNNMLTLYMNQIDDGLGDIESYMNTMTSIGNYDLISLGYASAESDYYSSKVYLYNKLVKDISLFPSIGSFFVYAGNRDDYMDVTQRNLSYEEKDLIHNYVVGLIKSGTVTEFPPKKRWQYYRIGQEDYLINIVKVENVYIGSWVKNDQLLSPLHSLKIGEGGGVLLTNKQGQPITDSKLVSRYDIDLNKERSGYYLTGSNKRFLVIGAPSTKGEFNLLALIPDQHILANLPYLQSIVWFITAASLLFVPLGFYFIRKSIFVPMNRLLLAMKKVRIGNWGSRVSLEDSSDEFKQLGESFNSMMTEIEELRVNVYEEQLNKQREELQRLQLQVNPHFFLNALNIVYNLAKVKNYELVLEMTMSLIRYFRFMFRSNTSLVKLKDELEHTRNYLRIQNLRFPDRLKWSINSPEYLSDVPIPPLVIQSFVENSVKHAFTMEDHLDVTVTIRFDDEDSGSRIRIHIADTGPGFDGQVLEELQAGRSVENGQGERTGIWNVQRRLRLMYNNEVTVNYYNDKESGGAVVEILLPTDAEREGTNELSTSPC